MYALNKQPKLKSSNHIFTHSAARGVGLAADQYGQSIGAEVFATLSSLKALLVAKSRCELHQHK